MYMKLNNNLLNIKNTHSTSETDVYSCNYVNNCNSYSTSEKYTGKVWINNKKIYRKVLLASKSDFSSSGHFYEIPTNVNNIEEYTFVTAFVKRESDVWNTIPNGFGSQSVNEWTTTLNDITKNSVAVQLGNNVYNAMQSDNSVIVIIEYTKTTD